MDDWTGHRVNYLAINMQFIHSKNMLVIKTLAVRDTETQFLQHTLETVLKRIPSKKQ